MRTTPPSDEKSTYRAAVGTLLLGCVTSLLLLAALGTGWSPLLMVLQLATVWTLITSFPVWTRSTSPLRARRMAGWGVALAMLTLLFSFFLRISLMSTTCFSEVDQSFH